MVKVFWGTCCASVGAALLILWIGGTGIHEIKIVLSLIGISITLMILIIWECIKVFIIDEGDPGWEENGSKSDQ
jgi:choline-glycine betaine transporter